MQPSLIYMRCSDVTKLSIRPHRNVNANKYWAESTILKFLCQSYLQTVYNSMRNSMQAYANVHDVTLLLYLQHGGVTAVVRVTTLSPWIIFVTSGGHSM